MPDFFSMPDFFNIKSLLDMAVQHKAATLGAFLLSSGVGAHIMVRLLILIPLEGWYSALRSTAAAVSAAGSTRLTKPLWTPVEDWFEAFLGKSVDAIREGLDSDDHPEGRKEEATPKGAEPTPLPPQSLEMLADKEPPLATGVGHYVAGVLQTELPGTSESPAKCGFCGKEMPIGEEMFKYHGYSGPCPTQPPAAPGQP